ncbi:MAG: AAA family ATPase [Firmicutes bacterium]|nr:AAA family ATPase [Bacillota bacterium]
MGIPVLILGASGSGKSTSLENFSENEVLVFNVAGKPFPFRKMLKVINNAGYDNIGKILKKKEFEKYVIDDSQYLLAFDLFDKAKEAGYGKFTDIAVRFYNMIRFVIKDMPEDVIVYFLHHTEETSNGKIKAKTVGKMLDDQLTLEGLFSIVLLAETDGESYRFVTQSDGYTTCKSPKGMFGKTIKNDLKAVDKTIRKYWNLEGNNNETN